MENPSDNLFRKVNAFAMRQLESSLTPDEQRELASLLRESAAARRIYAEYVQETACLRWLCLEEFAGDTELATPLRNEPNRGTSRQRIAVFAFVGSLACTLAAVSFGWMYFFRPGPIADARGNGMGAAALADARADILGSQHSSNQPQSIAGQQVATITGLRAVRWAQADDAGALLSRCHVGERLQLQEGAAELTFDAGVQLTVFGPADFEITSPTSIRCVRGRVTTLVNERGKGFTIETPKAKVVDLGTQFGLDISEDGETQVVVFQGSVDLTYDPLNANGDAPTRRLEQGEALLLKNSGEFQRVVSVERNQFLTGVDGIHRRSDEPVIVDVRDNIRKAESIKSYQIVHAGLGEDALCFVDRNHEWNAVEPRGLPEFLRDADYIMPFNDDKFVRDLEITVYLARPANLYVFLDNNMEVPRWLQENFTDTGVDIGLDGAQTEWHPGNSLAVGAGRSVDFPFSIWRREIKQPGTVTLGGLKPPEVRSRGFNMYGIAAVAIE